VDGRRHGGQGAVARRLLLACAVLPPVTIELMVAAVTCGGRAGCSLL
jgi:hypothetical protein